MRMLGIRFVILVAFFGNTIAPLAAIARPQNIYGVGPQRATSRAQIGNALPRIPRFANMSGVNRIVRNSAPGSSSNLSGIRSTRGGIRAAPSANMSGVKASIQNSFGVGRGYFGTSIDGPLPRNSVASDNSRDAAEGMSQALPYELSFPQDHDHSNYNFVHF